MEKYERYFYLGGPLDVFQVCDRKEGVFWKEQWA